MILYQCDACFEQEEHAGPDIPRGWASITATVRWMDRANDAGTDQECFPRLLCRKCRGENPDKLAVHIERMLSIGLDQRPRPAPEKGEEVSR